jgi:hypothetical protein
LVLAIAALSIVRVRAREFAPVTHFLRKPLKRLQSWRKEDLVFVASGFDFVALALVFLPPEL